MSAQLPDPIIITKRAGNVRIHTFIASFTYDNIANATHIIESNNKLVLVDSQFLLPYATKFRDYADSLKKPIERLYVSHRHPDHWFGLGLPVRQDGPAFSDIAIYALPETITYIRDQGEAARKDHKLRMGDLAPDKILVPQNVAEPGEVIIDGVRYIFDKVEDTEIDFLLTIRLPEIGALIVQDLIYSGTHLYLYPGTLPDGGLDLLDRTKNIKHWIAVLQEMLSSDYELFLPGHGFPADKNEVARNIEYLSAAKQAIDNGLTKGAFKEYMLRRYPERKCPGIFDIYLPRFFGSLSQFY